MSLSVRRTSRLWPAIAMAMVGLSSTSAAEARHDGYYSRELYRARGEDRDQRPTKPVNSLSRGDTSAPDRAKADNRGSVSDSRTLNNNPSAPQANGFSLAIGQMIGSCEEQATEFKEGSLEVIAQTIQPSDDQRDALDHIRSTATEAADMLEATCPKDSSATLSEKLGTVSRVLDLIVGSLTTLRPAFVTFYALLDDEQKARLAVNSFLESQSKSDDGSPVARPERAPDNANASVQGSACPQLAGALRGWPIKEIEAGMTLSDEQHAALYEVAAATYRAAGGLVTSCRGAPRLTSVGRLDYQREKLQVLRQGIDAVRPILAAFEDTLDHEQKKWFDTVVNPTSPEFRKLAP